MPAYPILDGIDQREANPIIRLDKAVRAWIGSYLRRLPLRYLGLCLLAATNACRAVLGNPISDIVGIRSQKQMGSIYTDATITSMQHLHPFGNGANANLIFEAMRKLAFVVEIDRAVSASVGAAIKVYAPIRAGLAAALKSLLERKTVWCRTTFSQDDAPSSLKVRAVSAFTVPIRPHYVSLSPQNQAFGGF